MEGGYKVSLKRPPDKSVTVRSVTQHTHSCAYMYWAMRKQCLKGTQTMHAIEERLIHCRRFFDHSALVLWAGGLASIIVLAALPAIA